MSSARSHLVIARSQQERRDYVLALALSAWCHTIKASEHAAMLDRADAILQYIKGDQTAKVPRHDFTWGAE